MMASATTTTTTLFVWTRVVVSGLFVRETDDNGVSFRFLTSRLKKMIDSNHLCCYLLIKTTILKTARFPAVAQPARLLIFDLAVTLSDVKLSLNKSAIGKAGCCEVIIEILV